VVVEAASMGIPVIISGSCAATDFIKNGETGIYFEHGSVSALAGQIARLRDHPDEARRLGQAAHQWYWAAPWTTARHVEELLGVYRGILGKKTEPVKTAGAIVAALEEVA
jgi:glycosyltransferase involved in cell wall biosynthesis